MGQQTSPLWPARLSPGVATGHCSDLQLVLGAVGPCLTSPKSRRLAGARPACEEMLTRPQGPALMKCSGSHSTPTALCRVRASISLILQTTKLRFRATEGRIASRAKLRWESGLPKTRHEAFPLSSPLPGMLARLPSDNAAGFLSWFPCLLWSQLESHSL